jgi:hypothetical protein
VSRLIAKLKQCEIVKDESYLSLPLSDAALHIWLERKVSALNLNAGETLRRDLVKLTPGGLARLLGASEGLKTPYEALSLLPSKLKDEAWVKEAKKSWNKSTNWPDAMSVLGNTASVAQAVIPTLFRSLSA